MATYREIQEYVKEKHTCCIKSCWIAHMKEICGLNPQQSPNRLSPDKRKYPCPVDKQPLIKDAFKELGMI